MKRAISTILIFCFVIFSFTYNIKAENKFEIHNLNSISAAVIDGDTGRVLFEKNGYEIRSMASTTKIMTLILALEYGDLESLVTVSGYAAKMPEVRMGMKEGEQYRLKDLLYAMMLESYNDCAVAIAEHISGSVEQFATLMNKKTIELGLNNTYFITPNGLDATNDNHTHSTNAVELSLLMRYCVAFSDKKDLFVKICQTKSYDFADYSNKRKISVTNKNRLLFEQNDMIAGKTGFTANSGYCYICALKKDDSFVVISLLGCGWPPNKNYKWKDVLNIWQSIEDGYFKREIINQENFHDEISVYDGYKNVRIPVFIKENIDFLVCDYDLIEISIKYDNLHAPIKKGDQVGIVEIRANGNVVKVIACYASESVQKPSYRSFVCSVIKRLFNY